MILKLSYSVLFCFCLFCWSSENDSHLVVGPESPVLEIGTDFMATCKIINTDEVTADDLYWNLTQTTVPKEQYTKINQSALNVTIPITTENKEWLFCFCKKVSPYVVLNKGKFMHGITLTKGCKFFFFWQKLKIWCCSLNTCIWYWQVIISIFLQCKELEKHLRAVNIYKSLQTYILLKFYLGTTNTG